MQFQAFYWIFKIASGYIDFINPDLKNENGYLLKGSRF